VGRWRSDNAPTGYWIVDRYADGRFAKRQYLKFDYAKPAELVLSWGRWQIRNHRYSETIKGTTSPTLMRFASKGLSWKVLEFSAKRFSFESNDGHPRIEERIPIAASLLDIKTPRPKNTAKESLIDTITSSHETIPAWINSVPRPTLSSTPPNPS